MNPSIFLSHSHHDTEFVIRLASDLSHRGARVWYYQAEIKVGESLIKKIGDAIEEMDFLGVVLSTHSVSSEWVLRELEIALRKEIAGKAVSVLPLLRETCQIPSFLAGKSHADFRSESVYRKGLDDVLVSLGIYEKAKERERVSALGRELIRSRAELESLRLSDYSPSDHFDVPERKQNDDLEKVFKKAMRDYEERFHEFYDPLGPL